ncbi:hypothetical protein [Sphingomonas jinjuensis]|nr:hypothetical protein [Sphingomonas jinjuensis]
MFHRLMPLPDAAEADRIALAQRHAGRHCRGAVDDDICHQL